MIMEIMRVNKVALSNLAFGLICFDCVVPVTDESHIEPFRLKCQIQILLQQDFSTLWIPEGCQQISTIISIFRSSRSF